MSKGLWTAFGFHGSYTQLQDLTANKLRPSRHTVDELLIPRVHQLLIIASWLPGF